AIDTELTPYQADCLATIARQAKALLTIINDILDFSKIESRTIELETVPFAIADVVADAMKPLGVEAEAKQLDIGSRIAPDVPPRLAGDPVRLQQVLTNLVANAVKFTERGSVRVAVDVDGRRPDGATRPITVAATGIGIQPDKLGAIFEPFRQADGSTTRRFGGTGLGLAISANLAELMGGRIWVDSEPGVGSTFHVLVACASAPQPAAAPASGPIVPPPAGPDRPVRVLVAEDNPVHQLLAPPHLHTLGHPVTPPAPHPAAS